MEETIRQVVGILCWWTLIGYFIAGAGAVSKPTSQKSALKQTFWLGPLFWIGIGIWGLCVLIKRKILAK